MRGFDVDELTTNLNELEHLLFYIDLLVKLVNENVQLV